MRANPLSVSTARGVAVLRALDMQRPEQRRLATDPNLRVKGAGHEVLENVGAGEAEALDLIAQHQFERPARFGVGKIGRGIERLDNELAPARKALAADGEGRTRDARLQMAAHR